MRFHNVETKITILDENPLLTPFLLASFSTHTLPTCVDHSYSTKLPMANRLGLAVSTLVKSATALR
jgi:hypothetical protein